MFESFDDALSDDACFHSTYCIFRSVNVMRLKAGGHITMEIK